MLLRRGEGLLLAVNIAYIAGFGAVYARNMNYEFIIYCLVILVFLGLVAASQRKVQFGLPLLWGLTAWGFLHMAGGQLSIGGTRLYDIMLLPVSTELGVLRYDQAVHAFGFGVATLVCHHLLKPNLGDRVNWKLLCVLIALMGMGVGALNEVIELIVVLLAPSSGVGGYYNTAFDMLFNMLGATLAVTWLSVRRRSRKAQKARPDA
jgi:putative membrane protein